MTREALVAELRHHVRDERVLDAIAAVDREAFVTPADRGRAWDNDALALGCGQTISQPLVVARMCEVLRIRPGDYVLDIGTGSGYHAAVLAALGARVASIEIVEELSARAAENLAAAGIAGVELVVGDGRLGHPPGAPYDAINVAASADALPSELLAQLGPGGRLVGPVRSGGRERLVLVTRDVDGTFAHHELEDVRFVPLV